MAGDLQTLKEKGVFRRSWKFRELQVRDPKKSGNLITVLCCFCEWLDFGVCAVSGWDNALAGNGGVAPPRFRNAGNGDFTHHEK